MRPHFSDSKRIHREARKNVDRGTASLRRWWANKYKLPPNHPLFLNQNVTDLNQEMLEDLMLQKLDIEKELEDGEPSERRTRNDILMEQLSNLNRALGESDSTLVDDDLATYWDEQLEQGEDPDLDMTVEDLRRIRREQKHAH